MTVTINSVRAQFHLDPPLITFLQGADMTVPAIRNTLRAIEETEEGRGQPFRQIVTVSGNVDFSETQDGSKLSALTIRVLSPYVCDFEAGAIPFVTSLGNFLFTGMESPGAVVKINNAVGATLVSAGGSIPTASEVAVAVWSALESSATGTQGAALSLLRKIAQNRIEETAGNPGTVTLYDDDGTTPIAAWLLTDATGGAVTETAGSPARRVPA